MSVKQWKRFLLESIFLIIILYFMFFYIIDARAAEEVISFNHLEYLFFLKCDYMIIININDHILYTLFY